MSRNATNALVLEIMQDYARLTGLAPANAHPRRYLWTDAFAVCNYLELFAGPMMKPIGIWLYASSIRCIIPSAGTAKTIPDAAGSAALMSRRVSGIRPGGLRIGKQLNERRPDEPPNERLEWDRDGQYYHYLTKWMHALNCVSQVTGDPTYIRWAMELAKTAHARFAYLRLRRPEEDVLEDEHRPHLSSGSLYGPARSSRRLCHLLRASGGGDRDFKESSCRASMHEIADMAEICRGMQPGHRRSARHRRSSLRCLKNCTTDGKGRLKNAGLLENVVDSALMGMKSFAKSETLEYPADYRLAFRELGLSIGLSAVENLRKWIEENPDLLARKSPCIVGLKTSWGICRLEKRSNSSGWMARTGKPAPGRAP